MDLDRSYQMTVWTDRLHLNRLTACQYQISLEFELPLQQESQVLPIIIYLLMSFGKFFPVDQRQVQI